MPFHRSTSAAALSVRARTLLLASIAALVVTSFDAHATPAATQPAGATGQQLAPGGSAEFGARKRLRARRGDAAGLAMMGMMIGAVGGVIASQQRRDAYESRRVYPAYGGGGYAYGHPQPYVTHQPQVYHQQPQVYRQPHAYRQGLPSAYDDPVINRLNQQSGAINYGPPRIGW